MPDASAHPRSAEPPGAETQPEGLAALRAELDRLDDALHDLLIERADVVARVAALGAKGAVPFRPGREAGILRRLLARHRGPLPPAALVRIWRELFAATTSMQGNHAVAVCDEDPAAAFTQCAREHFGALTPLHVHRTPARAIAEVSAGIASVAVLPMPAESPPGAGAPWWTALFSRETPRIHIIARLPFWAPRAEGAPQAEALVVAAVPADPSGNDRSLLGLELAPDLSRARLQAALTEVGLPPSQVLQHRDPAFPESRVLAEVAGCLAEADGRLAGLAGLLGAALLARPAVLGAYAVPEQGGAA